MSARTFVLTLVLACAAPAFAQPSAECPTSECLPTLQSTSPVHALMWRDAAAIHQLKIAFVGAVQRLVRAQAGTFGDEGEELRASVASMRAALAKWDQAIQQFQTKSSRNAADAESHVAMAIVWLDRHRLDAALRALDAAEPRGGGRVEVHTLRAIASGASDRWDDAVRALRRAIAIDARNPTLSYTLAQYLARLKRPGDATQALRGAQRALDTGRASTSAGQSPRFERVSLLSQSSDTAPIFAHARYADGFAALESGDYETAVAKFETAIATDPMLTGSSDARSRVVAAASALRSGQIDAALRQLQAAVEIFPNAPEAHRLLGLIYWIDDRAGKGIEHLRRAIQLAPADERARVLLSDVFASERRLAEAERELTQAADASVRSGQIPYRLAQIYLRRRCCPRRRRRFRTASRSHPWSAGIASTSRGAACW